MGKRYNVERSEYVTAEQVFDLLGVIEDRYDNKYAIFESQSPVSNWYEMLDTDVYAADAILAIA